MRPRDKRRMKSGNGVPPEPRGKGREAPPERTAAWPGLPGSPQRKSRSGKGFEKIKTHAKSEGI